MADEPRGTLTIRNKAAARIVERAALDVPGVVRSDSRLVALTGRGLPRAIVDMTRDDPNIRVDIAVQWPVPIAAVCVQVQRRIVADLRRYTDRNPSRVDVSVVEVIAARSAEGAADIVAHAHNPPDDPSPPRVRSRAVLPAIMIAIVLLALGIVAARELLVVRTGGRPIVAPVLGWIGRMTWQPWFLAPAVAAICVGAALVVAAMWPRRRPYVATAATPRMWLRTSDIARISTAAALRVDGVRDASTNATGRTVRVRVVPDPRHPPVAEVVTASVTSALAELATAPSVTVTIEPPRAEAKR